MIEKLREEGVALLERTVTMQVVEVYEDEVFDVLAGLPELPDEVASTVEGASLEDGENGWGASRRGRAGGSTEHGAGGRGRGRGGAGASLDDGDSILTGMDGDSFVDSSVGAGGGSSGGGVPHDRGRGRSLTRKRTSSIPDALRHGAVSPPRRGPRLSVSRAADGATVVGGAIEVQLADSSDGVQLMRLASVRRAVGTTHHNDFSSRSHCVYVLTLRQRNPAAKVSVVSRLYLVDLAGSESAKQALPFALGSGRLSSSSSSGARSRSLGRSGPQSRRSSGRQGHGGAPRRSIGISSLDPDAGGYNQVRLGSEKERIAINDSITVLGKCIHALAKIEGEKE